MAAASSAAGPLTPSKKRKVGDAGEAKAMDSIVANTQNKDLIYITKYLEKKESLISFVASWCRDGTLEAALKRQQAKTNNNWAPSTRVVRQIGLGPARSVCQRMNTVSFDPDRLEQREIYVSTIQYVRFAQFATRSKDATFLPAENVEASVTAMVNAATVLDRLVGAEAECDWQSFGYFTINPVDVTEAICLLQRTLTVKLPFTREFLEDGTAEWRIVDNHLTSSYLFSKVLDQKIPFRPLFVAKHGKPAVDLAMPLERQSFEPDDSTPAWCLKSLAKKPGKAKAVSKQAFAKAKALATNARALPKPKAMAKAPPAVAKAAGVVVG
jgi:hypothetical protein